MTKGCSLSTCGRSPAKKSSCCGMRLCETHAATSAAHSCPTQARLLSMTPADVKRWKLENAPEEAMTTAVVNGLNALQDIEIAWQSRKRGGFKANDGARAVADVMAISRPDGRHVEVELKGTHKDGCACDSCVDQRDRGERVRAAGGVYVAGVRKPQDAIDGVLMGLARARARGQERSAG